jgi:NAD(P)-dependent dehydrogenase (short-subunit alcohol dehydrogenase family)
VALYCAQERLEIRCNSVHPAAVLTPMWDAFLGEGPVGEERMLAIAMANPMRRWGSSSEVAETVVFLASDEALFMTGAEINIDGGLLAGEVEPTPE